MNTSIFQVGGKLAADNPSYVERKADKELYQWLLSREFCYVLNSRQTGKSSLQAHVTTKLPDEMVCASIQLTSIGENQITPEKWYYSLLNALVNSLKLKDKFSLPLWWKEHEALSPVQCLSEFIETVLLIQITQPIVIFIDEIDSILGLAFKDDFFALIRECYNKRAENPAYERLTFVLLGKAAPSDLIADTKRTPFNVGRSIQLKGFKWTEIQPLADGLRDEGIINSEVILQEILKWTGGQPFLTQKLCQRILFASPSIPVGSEAEYIEKLVHSQIIEDWEIKDDPLHLKTIRKLLLDNEQYIIRRLGLYQQILEQDALIFDGSHEQMDLRLSGLVVEEEGKLRVYNCIYEEIFNLDWVKQELSKLRPYAKQIQAWEASNFQDESCLLRGKELHKAQIWAKNRSLSDVDYKFLGASQDIALKEANRQSRFRGIALLGLILPGAVTLIGILIDWTVREINLQTFISSGDKVLVTSKTKPPGDKVLVTSNTNPHKEAGVREFASGDLKEAIKEFQASLKLNRNDPETLIYLNNAKADNNALKIVVSVPIDNRVNVAEEILRGVAQAQNEINQKGGINGKLLQVEIANDNNDPKRAMELAAKFVADSSILAVVGHNSSDASVVAAPVYQQGKLVMISPTSFVARHLLNFSNYHQDENYIFRAVPSIHPVVDTLTNYAIKTVHPTKVAVCYDFQAVGDQSFSNDFAAAINSKNAKFIDIPCDLSEPDFDPRGAIFQAINAGANTLLLSPGLHSLDKAREVAKANKGRLALLGSPALYTSEPLQSGQEAVNGMVLAVFWHPSLMPDKPFASNAVKLWGGPVNWRTAMAYDATQVVITGLKHSQTRTGLQQVLSNPEFSASGVIGEIKFFRNGDRIGKAYLVKVQQDKHSSLGYKFVPLGNGEQETGKK